MPSEAFSMEEQNPFEKLVLLLVGTEKSGKSRLAATAPGPILHLDYDKRRAALAGIKGVYSITFHDPPYPQMPTIASETLDLMQQLEKPGGLRLSNLVSPEGKLYFPNVPSDIEIRTIVNDSISTMAKAFMNYILYCNSDKGFRYAVNIAGKYESYTPRTYAGWNSEVDAVSSVFLRQIAIPKLNVIAISHETWEEDKESTDENPRYTGKVIVYPPRYRMVLKYFSEVWRLRRESSAPPAIYAVPNWAFENSATNLNLSQEEIDQVGPNITYLIQKAIDLGRIKPMGNQPKALTGEVPAQTTKTTM